MSKKKQGKWVCYKDNGEVLMALTNKQLDRAIEIELEHLIDLSCKLNDIGSIRNIKEIAEEVVEIKAGTDENRAILSFMLANDMIPEYTYKYAE